MCLKTTEINVDFPKCLAELEYSIAEMCPIVQKNKILKSLFYSCQIAAALNRSCRVLYAPVFIPE